MVKLFVFAPSDERLVKKIIAVAAKAGAGVIGNYTHCAFVARGRGTWVAGEKANPRVGSKQGTQRIKEVKIEMNCPENKIKSAVNAIKKVHPYEEVVIDVVKLETF